MRSSMFALVLVLGVVAASGAQAQPLDPGYGYVVPAPPMPPPPPPPRAYYGNQGYYYPPTGYAAPIYSYPPPPVYYRVPPPPRRRPPRICRDCNLEHPRFFSIGLRATSLSINQSINGHDVTLGGGGFQMRFRNRGHFGIEAAVDFLHGDFHADGPTPRMDTPTTGSSSSNGNTSGGYFHVGDVSRDSIPFSVSALIYIFPNTDARIFNMYFLGGLGVIGTSMSLLDENGVRTQQDFTEYEAHLGIGSELRFRWFAIDASVRALGLARDDSSAPASYYTGVSGAPVPASSVGVAGTLAATLWF